MGPALTHQPGLALDRGADGLSPPPTTGSGPSLQGGVHVC